MAQPLLAVRVSHGLCNRLRVLLSAIAYSEVTGRELRIRWPRTRKYHFPLRRLWEHDYVEIGGLRWHSLTRRADGCRSAEEMRLDLSDPVVCVRTTSVFGEGSYPQPLIRYLDRLRPVPELREAIDTSAAEWERGAPVVGVSVRTVAAHPDSARESPLEWFIERMNGLLARHPTIRFYLSADARAAEETVRAAVAAPIHVFPKSYTYNRPRGVREALCDLYLLARTNYVLGAHMSSFSQMAGDMRGAEAYETSLTARPDEAIDRLLTAS